MEILKFSDGQPPKKKPKTWRRGTFNEDPFVFFEKDEKHLMKMKTHLKTFTFSVLKMNR